MKNNQRYKLKFEYPLQDISTIRTLLSNRGAYNLLFNLVDHSVDFDLALEEFSDLNWVHWRLFLEKLNKEYNVNFQESILVSWKENLVEAAHD